MKLEHLPLTRINFKDETFRISEELEPAQLRSSLQSVGQINPVVLLEGKDDGNVIVCGFRRLRLLRQLGAEHAAVFIRSSSDCSPLSLFHLAIWDNVSHRQLCPLEKARIVRGLRNIFNVPQETLVEKDLPVLELPAHKNVLNGYLRLNELHADLKRLLNRDWISLSGALRLAGYAHADQVLFASALAKVRFSSSLLRQVLDLVEEIAAVSDCSVGEALTGSEVQAILADERLSPFQKGEAIHVVLYEKGHPRLCRARERFNDEKRRLNLPGNLHLISDPFFETTRVKVEFESFSPGDFREMTAALNRAAQNPALDRIFEIE
jgi:hypothetical protein